MSLFILFFVPKSVCAECEVTQANSEAEASSIVEGVNVITGSYSFTVPVHHVPGAQPLTFYKSFNSHDYRVAKRPFWSESFFGSLSVGRADVHGKKHTVALYVEDGGASIFLIEPSKKKDLCLKLSHEYSPTRGVTNTSRGVIGASTNLSNLTLEMRGRKSSDALLTKPDGTQQNFKHAATFYGEYHYRLEDQIFPSGNRSQCHYGDKGHRVATTFTNADQSTLFLKEHYAFISHDKKKHTRYLSHVFSDGSKSAESVKKYIKRNGNIEEFYYCLKSIQPIGAPEEFYYYDYESSPNWTKLMSRDRPDERYISLDYYEIGAPYLSGKKWKYMDETNPQVGRIRYIFAPAGHNKNPIAIYSFKYHIERKSKKSHTLLNGHTFVTDGNKNVKKYVYDKNHRLTSIDQLGKNSEGIAYRQNIFSWSEDGKLVYTTLNDQKGRSIHYKHFDYDLKGNPIKEECFGYYSKEQKSFSLENGIPSDTDLECHTTVRTYADNRFNHLLTSDNGELLTQYTYLEGTDLLSSKRVTDQNNISIRTFCTYDHNKALIEEICDNGMGSDKEDLSGVTQRTIRRITPKTEGSGIGLPLIEELYGYEIQTGREKLIGKTVNTYNSQYKLIKQDIYDANSEWVYCKQWVYNKEGNLIEEIDALGNVSLYDYDANYNRIYYLSPSGQKEFFYTYDFMNRLIKKELKDPQGNSYTTSFRYDVMGNLVAEIDHYGNETEFVFDAYNRCVQIKRPPVAILDGSIQKPVLYKEYDESDNITCEIDAQGASVSSKYNSFNQPVCITYADGSQECMRYDIFNRVVEKTERNGTKKIYQYDALGRTLQESILDIDGSLLSTQTNHYNAFHLLSSTDAMGLTTTYSYDYAGRLVCERTEEKCLTKTYDALGRLETETLHNGEQTRVTRFSYDFNGQLIDTIIEDVEGNLLSKASIGYDQEGRKNLVQNYDAQGSHSTYIEYDALDRTVNVILPDGNHFYAFYDDRTVNEQGQTVASKYFFTPDGHQTHTFFDTWGRVVRLEKYNLRNALIHKKEHFYDLNNNLIKECYTVHTPNQSTRTVINTFSYDSLGHLMEQIEGLGDVKQRITSYTYHSTGEKASCTKADGITLYYNYDALGRLSHEFSSDKSIDTYWEYNLKNQPTRVTDIQSTTLRSYDLYGRLVQEKLGNRLTLKYSYDLDDRLLSLEYPDGTTAYYTHDPLHLTQISYKDQTTYYHYNAFGQLQSQTLANGDTIDYSYDVLQRLQSAIAKLFSQNDLTYDLIGNLTGYTLNGKRCSFDYDDYNQISKEEGIFSHRYAHDSLHNRIQKDDENFIYNALNQILSKECSYDANGNLTRYKETFYTYDAHDRLLKVESPDFTENYTYDPFHRRLTNGSICYAYQDTNEIAAFKYLECVEKRILGLGKGGEVGSAVLIELDGNLYTPYHDHRGNVCAIAQEAIVESYDYHAFGEEGSKEARNPWRFSSKRQDATGLIYFGYRYYIPELGRWLTPDPIGLNDGPNRYAYCVNDPIGRMDLYGLNSFKFTWYQRDLNMSSSEWRQDYGAWHQNYNSYRESSGFNNQGLRLWQRPGRMLELAGQHLSPLPQEYKFVARVGRWAQGKGFSGCDPDYVPSHIIPYGSVEAQDKIENILVNGMMTTFGSGFAKKEMAEGFFGEEMGYMCFVSSHGFCNDGLSAGADLCRINTMSSELLRFQIINLFINHDVKEIYLYGESRGGAVVMSVVGKLPKWMKQRINVRTLGSASLAIDDDLKSLEHHIDTSDIIPFLANPLRYIWARIFGHKNIFFHKNDKKNVLNAHDYFGEDSTYVGLYRKWGDEYRTRPTRNQK